jgi:hypothetical protein
MLFVGGKDLEFRTGTITGLFLVNRRAGALWALAEEPGAAHVVGRSRDMSEVFFEDVLAIRVGQTTPGTAGPAPLAAMTEKSGFVGDPTAKTVRPAADAAPSNAPTAWLPTRRVADAWLAVVTEKPFVK